MTARIYQPAKTAMQSGWAKTKHWVLEFEPSLPKSNDPLMGWTSSGDTRQQVQLQFDTREEAIAYMMENTGMAEQEVTAEVERYIVVPGQALAYKVGMLSILGLRERARSELGDNFDLKAFHNEILGHGALPMTELDRVVDDWIAAKRR